VEGYKHLQYCDNLKVLNPKLLALIKKYGKVFDGSYEYELSGNPKPIILRRPVIDFKDEKQ